ncbi:MAG: T9SS type A sorting domain-containing protein [Sphingobacteriales bacterium JAD_PAG50586_3]|nr:MAG: T9SS type A sorting domain-containing protein [Sphingobacteriales bacterium JAD_PAG50586_3]
MIIAAIPWCDQIIAAGIEDMASTVSSIYPNPTSGSIFISLFAKQNTDLQLTVYNLLGQPVLRQNNTVAVGNQTIQLPTENLAQGIYIVQIADKKTGAVVTKKIVKD